MNSQIHNAIIVAHPDDETLWCGGELLKHPKIHWFVASMCRKNDPDRAPKFKTALAHYQAQGIMNNLDDGPEQSPLDQEHIEKAILESVPERQYNRIFTHSPFGEYTRHRRHEEIGRAVINLWHKNKIITDQLWLFAYEDGNKSYVPRAIENADYCEKLSLKIWLEKYHIITKIYRFDKSGFEARTTPEKEAFWKFKTPESAIAWLEKRSKINTA